MVDRPRPQMRKFTGRFLANMVPGLVDAKGNQPRKDKSATYGGPCVLLRRNDARHFFILLQNQLRFEDLISYVNHSNLILRLIVYGYNKKNFSEMKIILKFV